MSGGDRDSGWIAWFVRNPTAANLLMATLLAVGGMTFVEMRTEGFPEPVPNDVTLTVHLDGGSPEELEEGAVIKIEEALDGVEGAEKIVSSISQGEATILIKGRNGYPVADLKDGIRARVDAISTFPERMERIVVAEARDERHVVYVQIHGDVDHRTLKEVASRIRERLLALPAVNSIALNGDRSRQISIEVREEQLRAYDLSFDEVAEATARASVNLSAGTLRTSAGQVTLQSRNQQDHGGGFESVVVRSSRSGGAVQVGDVATVVDGYSEQAILSSFQGQPSINLDVMLIGRESVIEASSQVVREIERIRGENWLPDSVAIATWNDEADAIRDSIGLLSKNALIGMLLVFGLLALFLAPGSALWVAAGVPVAFAGAAFVMGPQFMDYSINDLTVFAFLLVLGIVVDDAIVIAESIHTHQRTGGGVDATIRGVNEVAVPATFGVLTTVAAFFPLTMMVGDFSAPFRMIGVVVIACLLFSLVESKLILPAHLVKPEPSCDGRRAAGALARSWFRVRRTMDASLESFVSGVYIPLALAAVRRKYQSLGVFVAVLIATVGLLTGGVVKVVFFDDENSSLVFASLKAVAGTTAAETHRIARHIEREARSTARALRVERGLDVSPLVYSWVLSEEDEAAVVSVQITPGSERPFPSQSFLEAWHRGVGHPANVEELSFFVDFEDSEDLRIELSSREGRALEEAMKTLVGEISAYGGIHDLATNLENSALDLSLSLKPEALRLGLSNSDIIEQVQGAVLGREVQRIFRGNEEVPVKVRYPISERDQIGDLRRMRIRTADGGTAPLSQVADIEHTRKTSRITRVNGKRVLVLTARLDESVISPSELAQALEERVLPGIAAAYPGVTVDVAGDIESEGEATSELGVGFVLGLLVVYSLLAVPLRSYVDPLVIMAAVPFGVVGAILGHLIIGIPLSLLSFFGILALTGVVVNDSLILVTRFHRIRARGSSGAEAIVEAGRSRFRAVFLTSVTAFSGLFPLILETSEQAQELIPMAVSLAFGILFASLVTLLVIPVLVSIRIDVAERLVPAPAGEGMRA